MRPGVGTWGHETGRWAGAGMNGAGMIGHARGAAA